MSIDPLQERHARRAAQRRRIRRRRLIAGTVGALVVAGGGLAIAGVLRSDDTPPGDAAQPAARTTPQPARTTTTPARTATTPAAPAPDAAPDATQAAAAVDRVAVLGVPIYRGGGRNGKVIALTFDDGPGPYTATTLATLKRYGARATFFLNRTSIERFPSPLSAQAQQQELGNHSWHHAYLPGLAPADAWREVTATTDIIQQRTRITTTLFRPPYGAHTPDLQARTTQAGMAMILWDIDSRDSQGDDYATMLANMKRQIRPGSIVLLHENRGQTQMLINRLLPWLKKKGYTMVGVSELLVRDPPTTAQVKAEAARRAGGPAGTRY